MPISQCEIEEIYKKKHSSKADQMTVFRRKNIFFFLSQFQIISQSLAWKYNLSIKHLKIHAIIDDRKNGKDKEEKKTKT